MLHGWKCILSMANVWGGEPVDDRVSDDNNAVSASSQRPLQMAGEIRNPEGLMANDLEGTPEHLLELIGGQIEAA